MPFNLNIAPRVFTKLTVVANRFTQMRIDALFYLEDWLVSAHSEEQANTSGRKAVT